MQVDEEMRMGGDQKDTVLIDGGATHCLRQVVDEAEWQAVEEVRVQTASGEVTLRQSKETATLLSREPVQTIIPVGRLVQEGYSIRWDKVSCHLEHVRHGRVPVDIVQGCPVVSQEWGATMLAEIEETERRRSQVRAVMMCGVIAETDHEKQLAELGAVFPEVPIRVLERVPGYKQWDPKQVPFNRRQRRRLAKAEHIMIDMFAGPDRKKWKVVEDRGTAVLAVDLSQGANVLDPHVSGFVDSIIATGKVTTWVAGPPCRTVSACRMKDDGGPRRLRHRDGEGRFGVPGLMPGEIEKVDSDTVLWVKNLWWMIQARRRRTDVRVLLEQPRDPEEWLRGTTDGLPAPSFLAWKETTVVTQMLGLQRVILEQGALGHTTRKPTTLVTNMTEVKKMHGLRFEGTDKQWPEDVSQRVEWSATLAAWAPGLVAAIATEAIEAMRVESKVVKALTARERRDIQDWQEHYRGGHFPYRRDCAVCLETTGRDRPRRTVPTPDSFCMSLDLAGPFKPGEDQDVYDAKYMLVAVVTVPVKEEMPLVESLRELGVTVRPLPEERQDGAEEDAAEDVGGAEEEEEAVWIRGEEEEDTEDPGQVDLEEFRKLEGKWKEFLGEAAHVKVKGLTFAVPLQSRKTQKVIEAVSMVYSRVRALQIPILRVHTDRAREFCSRGFKRWLADRDLHFTMSAGDEPTGNARAEREIGHLKGRVRALLKGAGAPREHWPMAVRHAAEERLRGQLKGMGIKTPGLIPFGASVVAKKKLWHQRHDEWKQPMERVTCWGPASDMSITSHGYYVCNEEGCWYRSTVLVQPQQLARNNAAMEEIARAAAADEGDNQETPEASLELHPPGSGPGGVHPHDLPRRRQHGKGPPRHGGGQGEEPRGLLLPAPSLRALLRQGGEVSLDLNVNEQEEKGEEEMRMLQLLQHWQLGRIVQEQSARMTGGEGLKTADFAVLHKAVEEIKELEGQLNKVQLEEKPEEVLQSRTVSLEEVYAEVEKWTPAFKKEVETLTNGPVIRVSKKDLCGEPGEDYDILPAKAVAVIKPEKLKGRVVVCGNMAVGQAHEDTSVGGVDSMAVRTTVHVAANRGWEVGSTDVKSAFLQAPRRGGKTTYVQPPQVLQKMGLVAKDEVWRVQCALYGFVESPSDWGACRDKKLKTFEWEFEGEQMQLVQSPERHLWWMRDRLGEMRGLVGVYVDDILAAGEKNLLDVFFREINGLWECTPPEYAEREKSMRFCGFEIRKTADGFDLHQESYIRDMLQRHQVEATEHSPLPKVEEGEDEEDKKDLREAQMLAGELNWVTQRSRPDLAYATGLVSRLLHRRPTYACKLAWHVMKYLKATPGRGLCYRRFEEDKSRQLPVECNLRTLEAFADASYAPPVEQYRSISGVVVEHRGNVLAWTSARQAFITQSTAEAELVAYNEAYQMGESVASLLQVVGYEVQRRLLGDNRAALTLCSAETGPWRTRHLRLRAAKLREAIQEEDGGWTSHHIPGATLVADGLTKSLQGQAFQAFAERLKRSGQAGAQETPQGRPEGGRAVVAAAALAAGGGILLGAGQRHLGLALLCACLVVSGKELRTQKKGMKSQGGHKRSADKEGMPYGGEASPENTAQEGKSDTDGASPGLRALRLKVEVSHGEAELPAARQNNQVAKAEVVIEGMQTATQSWRASSSAATETAAAAAAAAAEPDGDGAARATSGSSWRASEAAGEDDQGKDHGVGGGIWSDGPLEGPVEEGRGTGQQRVKYFGPAPTGIVFNAFETYEHLRRFGRHGDMREEDGPGVLQPVDPEVHGGPDPGRGAASGHHGGPDLGRGAASGHHGEPDPGHGTDHEPLQLRVVGVLGGASTRSGGPRARAAAAGYGEGGRDAGGQQEPQTGQVPTLGEPWNLPWVGTPPPRGRDIWNVGSLREGWLVREHRHPRREGFDPRKVYDLPCDLAELKRDRWTMIFYADGSQELVEDEWVSRRPWVRKESWVGYTIVCKKQK